MSAPEQYSRRYLLTAGIGMAAVLIIGAILVATFYTGRDEPMGDARPTPSTVIDVETGEVVTVPDQAGRPSSIPRPEDGTGPVDDGDPGGWQQLALFFLIGGSMVFIGVMVFRGTSRARRNKAMWVAAAQPGQEEQRRAARVATSADGPLENSNT